jgi:hypothetical protein
MPFQAGHHAVFGIYPTIEATGETVERLKRAGFPDSGISVLMPAKPETDSVGYRRGTKAPEGVAAGAGGGALVGGGLGWLAGMGALGIPGIGPFMAAGPLLSTLAGIGIGGTVGGIAGALVGMGVPEYEARRYEGFVKEGKVLLSVHVEDGSWAAHAKKILKDSGAQDISIAEEEKAPVIMTGNVHPFTHADDYQFHK